MLDAGADVRYVAEMLGHQKLETTMIYTRVSMAKLLAVHAACHPAENATPPRRSETPHTLAGTIGAPSDPTGPRRHSVTARPE